jgi:putative endonuclease
MQICQDVQGSKTAAVDGRAMRGRRSHLAGLAAEDQVARLYSGSGMPVCARRWRGHSGEIDIIARDGERVVFIEVKQSRTHTEAASHLSPWQMQRIWNTAEEYLAGEPQGALTDVRIDVALVDGMGRIEILQNAYAA